MSLIDLFLTIITVCAIAALFAAFVWFIKACVDDIRRGGGIL